MFDILDEYITGLKIASVGAVIAITFAFVMALCSEPLPTQEQIVDPAVIVGTK